MPRAYEEKGAYEVQKWGNDASKFKNEAYKIWIEGNKAFQFFFLLRKWKKSA